MKIQDKNKFNLSYFIQGKGKEDWFKALGYGWRLLFIIFFTFAIIFTIWRAFFKPLPTQNIKVGQGGRVTINNAQKRLFIPFIEGGIEKNSDVDFDTYVRGGLRFEF